MVGSVAPGSLNAELCMTPSRMLLALGILMGILMMALVFAIWLCLKTKTRKSRRRKQMMERQRHTPYIRVLH